MLEMKKFYFTIPLLSIELRPLTLMTLFLNRVNSKYY